VESEEGKGSTFWFTVWLDSVRADPAESDPGKEVSLKGRRVLVVDDNASQLRALKETLESWGMEPIEARTGRESIERMKSGNGGEPPPRLVLMDNLLPDMDGFEAAAEIRALHPASPPMVIMLAAAGQRGDALRCKQAGIAAYLAKPFRKSLLRGALTQALQEMELPGEKKALITRHTLRNTTPQNPCYRILLVEDNPVNQKVAMRLLEKQGFSVTTADDGAEALKRLDEGSYDLILMDVQMPNMSGLEATEAIRSREAKEGGHIPIIALTAHALKGDRDDCLQAGMDDYLTKPIQAAKLMETIQTTMTNLDSGASVDLAAPCAPAAPGNPMN